MKVLAVGDIHTKSWIIEEVFRLVDSYDKIVFCGDYADNWNTEPIETIKTWQMLRLFMETHKDKVLAVIGNHDYAYVHSEIAGRSSGYNQITQHLLNTPENESLKQWLHDLPVTLEVDGVTFSHAGITQIWDGDESVDGLWRDTSPIWARPPAWGGVSRYKPIPQVIGHNPVEKIWQVQKGIYLIDTFSETQNNEPIGDQTFLEIIDGKEFNTITWKNDSTE